MPVMVSPELTAGLIGMLLGAAGAVARWFSEIVQGNARWVAMHFAFILLMGGFMGYMGTALAEATGEPQWANVLSGSLGASGAFGFDIIIKRIIKMSGL